jgi:small multidrug resistance pump
MSYVYLALSILFEVAGTLCLKASNGFTRLIPAIALTVCYLLCFQFLGLALKKLDVGMIYAIWAGVGTALITVAGIFLFRDPFTLLKGISILLIILGVIGLNLSGSTH